MKIFLSFSRFNAEDALLLSEALKNAGHTLTPDAKSLDDLTDRDFNYNEWLNPDYWVPKLFDSDIAIALFSPPYKASRRIQKQLSVIQQVEKPLLSILVEGNEQDAIPFGFESMDYINTQGNLKEHIPTIIQVVASLELSASKNQGESLPEEVEKKSLKSATEQDSTVHKIFIAYSRKQRDIAKSLYDLLVSNGQFAFWDAKLRAGANWRQTIQRALDECTHVIVIWTPDAAQSDEVDREVSYALAKHKTIIPILSKEIPELPYHLYGLHYLVLEKEVKALESALIEAIEQLSSNDDLFA